MSDGRTREQREADEALLEAIQRVVRLQPTYRDADGEERASQGDEVVTEFVVVAACTTFDLVDRNLTRYSLITRDGGEGPYASPAHSIEGLLYRGLDS